MVSDELLLARMKSRQFKAMQSGERAIWLLLLPSQTCEKAPNPGQEDLLRA